MSRLAARKTNENNFIHPYSDLREIEGTRPKVISRGDGIYVEDDNGQKYIEGVAALWYASLGFSEARLAEAAHRQMLELPCYHAFFNTVTPAAADLTRKLLEIAPEGLSHVLYSSSGSEANDSAIKLVRYYNDALGRPEKCKIISRKLGYHGTTLAAASVTGVPRNHDGFGVALPYVIHVECPNFYRNGRNGETEVQYADRLAAEIEAIIEREGADTIAAFWAEPVMGVGGVVIPPATYFDKIQKILKKHDILFVVDEVITGFGRIGDMFGCETFNLKPDMLVLAKALSSGYQPISALLVNGRVYDAIADNSAKYGTFGHGYTYTAHPVAAAVALETLKIYEERDIVGRVRALAPKFRAHLDRLKASPIVGDIRQIGLIAGIEFVADVKTKAKFPTEMGVGYVAEDMCRNHGLILRALGDVLAVSPPLIISEPELDLLFERLTKAVKDTEEYLKSRRG